MSHFYGSMKGNRGETTRCGSKASGISAHIRGWNVGVRIVCSHHDEVDHVRVYRTGGSNGVSGEELVTEFRK